MSQFTQNSNWKGKGGWRAEQLKEEILAAISHIPLIFASKYQIKKGNLGSWDEKKRRKNEKA